MGKNASLVDRAEKFIVTKPPFGNTHDVSCQVISKAVDNIVMSGFVGREPVSNGKGIGNISINIDRF